MKKYFIFAVLLIIFMSLYGNVFSANEENKQTNTGPTLSGEVKDGMRIIEVKASKYKFQPDPIIVKKGEKVRLEVTSEDVAHGLAISDFKVNVVAKKDIVNTVEFMADKAGDFIIYCSVYCGAGHGNMKGKLKVIE